ncbi:hypothetical protein AMJ85_04395 [candidate division BRC1 bacterium SM23_51]|nr:MAG: hypothetical protein AMJ85_04395 [candidate division BRC1 bacterium SM23_51]
MPDYYPVCLELAKLPCLIVGGGAVGLRKARALVESGAPVTIVAPGATSAIKRLAEKGRVALRLRAYRTSDLRGKRLVFAATDDENLNRRIAREARQRGLLTNVADAPQLCDFIVPSIVRRGRLLLAISTEGTCPAYAKRLRTALEEQFDRAHGDYVELLGRMRREIHARVADAKAAVALLERLLDEDLLSIVRRKGRRAAQSRARVLLDTWLQDDRP